MVRDVNSNFAFACVEKRERHVEADVGARKPEPVGDILPDDFPRLVEIAVRLYPHVKVTVERDPAGAPVVQELRLDRLNGKLQLPRRLHIIGKLGRLREGGCTPVHSVNPEMAEKRAQVRNRDVGGPDSVAEKHV